jgi:hypothetical protein
MVTGIADTGRLVHILEAAGYITDIDKVPNVIARRTINDRAAAWDAFRVLDDSIQFAMIAPTALSITSTTLTGEALTVAAFSADRYGQRMFTVAAELKP